MLNVEENLNAASDEFWIFFARLLFQQDLAFRFNISELIVLGKLLHGANSFIGCWGTFDLPIVYVPEVFYAEFKNIKCRLGRI